MISGCLYLWFSVYSLSIYRWHTYTRIFAHVYKILTHKHMKDFIFSTKISFLSSFVGVWIRTTKGQTCYLLTCFSVNGKFSKLPQIQNKVNVQSHFVLAKTTFYLVNSGRIIVPLQKLKGRRLTELENNISAQTSPIIFIFLSIKKIPSNNMELYILISSIESRAYFWAMSKSFCRDDVEIFVILWLFWLVPSFYTYIKTIKQFLRVQGDQVQWNIKINNLSQKVL